MKKLKSIGNMSKVLKHSLERFGSILEWESLIMTTKEKEAGFEFWNSNPCGSSESWETAQ